MKYLLSGIALCGRERCDREPLMATTNGAGRVHVYRCRRCYLARHRERVDEVVMGTIAARLSRPDAAALLSTTWTSPTYARHVTELRERRDGLASLLAEGLLEPDAVRVQAKRLGAQIGDLERDIACGRGCFAADRSDRRRRRRADVARATTAASCVRLSGCSATL